MLFIRFFLLLVILFTVLFFSLNPPKNVKLSLAEALTKPIYQQFNALSEKIPILKNLQNILGSADKLKFFNLQIPNSDSLQKAAQNLPAQISQTVQDSLPKIEELVTNTRKEELYLKAPKSFSLPEIKVESFNQELTVQLLPFEVKDSRTNGAAWTLTIDSQDLVGEKGTLKKENISFRLKKEHVEVLEGRLDEIEITDGEGVVVKAKEGQGRGLFRFRPLLTVHIPQDSFSGSYRAEVQSRLE